VCEEHESTVGGLKALSTRVARWNAAVEPTHCQLEVMNGLLRHGIEHATARPGC